MDFKHGCKPDIVFIAFCYSDTTDTHLILEKANHERHQLLNRFVLAQNRTELGNDGGKGHANVVVPAHTSYGGRRDEVRVEDWCARGARMNAVYHEEICWHPLRPSCTTYESPTRSVTGAIRLVSSMI